MTVTQPELVEYEELSRRLSIESRFQAFHEQHPDVYRQLVSLARQAQRRGHARIGIGMLWEVLRWERLLRSTDPTSEHTLNDNYRSRYARLIMEQEADLAGMFELRRIRRK